MKILIADDHALLRRGVIQVLADEFPAAYLMEAATTAETMTNLAQGGFDLLILDIFMPGRNGLEVLSEVRRMPSAPPVLVLSSAPEDQMAVRVLRAGARGYLNKQAASEHLVEAVGKVLSGGRYVSNSVAEQLAIEIGVQEHDNMLGKLSNREFDVLQFLVSGKSISAIASELSLSPKTISTYHSRIWEKLRVKNDIEMVRYAIMHGMDQLLP